ncbi:MAG: zinc ribbon domain-containing protein [Actinomycetota bacterium]
MADRCWRCGTETVAGDSFCRSCGAQVSASAPDLDVVTDLAPPPPAPVDAAAAEPRRWPLVVGIALVGVVVGVFALTNTDQGPSADPYAERAEFAELDEPAGGADATTDDDVPLVYGTVDDQLDWQPIRVEADGYPVTAIEIGGSLFVYESTAGFTWEGVTGVSIIEYQPAAGTWIDHGLVADPGARVVTVTEIEGGVAATGLDAAGRQTVWFSDDGIEFTPTRLPAIVDPDGKEIRPQNLIEHDGTMMITTAQESPWQIVTAEIAERTADLDLLGSSWTNDTETLRIRGPFGIELTEIALEDLGIDSDDLNSPVDEPLPFWIDDGDGWRIETLDAKVFGARGLPDGGILVTTLGDRGMQGRTYQDGEWEERTIFLDRFVGVGPSGAIGVSQDHSRLYELDEDLDLDRALAVPAPSDFRIDNWHIDPDGILVALSRWDGVPEVDHSDSDRVVLAEGDYRLIADVDHLLELEHDGEPVRTINTWSSDDAGYRVDLDAEIPTVTFLDEETGTPLVTFELADIIELERASRPPEVYPTQAVTTAFTPGDDVWFVGDLTAEPFDTTALVQVSVTGDQLVAFVTAARDGFDRFGPTPDLVHTIHVAPVPG